MHSFDNKAISSGRYTQAFVRQDKLSWASPVFRVVPRACSHGFIIVFIVYHTCTRTAASRVDRSSASASAATDSAAATVRAIEKVDCSKVAVLFLLNQANFGIAACTAEER